MPHMQTAEGPCYSVHLLPSAELGYTAGDESRTGQPRPPLLTFPSHHLTNLFSIVQEDTCCLWKQNPLGFYNPGSKKHEQATIKLIQSSLFSSGLLMWRCLNYFRLLLFLSSETLIALALHFGKNMKGHQNDWGKRHKNFSCLNLKLSILRRVKYKSENSYSTAHKRPLSIRYPLAQ